MSESQESKKESRIGNWFKNLKMEFKKIIWPGKKELVKQTVVVLVTAICLGIIIAIIDMGIQYGIQFLVQ